MFKYRKNAVCLYLLSISVLLSTSRLSLAQVPEPLALQTTVSLPGIDGDFDHFAYDLKRSRLIVAAEELLIYRVNP